MISIRKAVIGAMSLAVAGIGFVGTPAAKATGETCTVVAVAANVSNPSSAGGGLWYPIIDGTNPLDGGANFSWNFSGTCAEGYGFTSSGSGKGWCGRSVGDGTGVANGRSYTVHWESAATNLLLTDPSAAGSVNAQPNPPGSPEGSCTNGSARTFYVSGVVVNLT